MLPTQILAVRSRAEQLADSNVHALLTSERSATDHVDPSIECLFCIEISLFGMSSPQKQSQTRPSKHFESFVILKYNFSNICQNLSKKRPFPAVASGFTALTGVAGGEDQVGPAHQQPARLRAADARVRSAVLVTGAEKA